MAQHVIDESDRLRSGINRQTGGPRRPTLEAQAEKILDTIVDGGESAKSLNRPGMARLLALVDAGEIEAVIIAKLDRLTRSVKDLCTPLERFSRRNVTLFSCRRPQTFAIRNSLGARGRLRGYPWVTLPRAMPRRPVSAQHGLSVVLAGPEHFGQVAFETVK